MSFPRSITRNNRSVSCADFNLRETLHSGQVFLWKETEPGLFRGWIGRHQAQVSQEGDLLLFNGVPESEIRRFFSLDVDLPVLARGIDVDPVIHEALHAVWGLRLIRQDPWECTAAFILSAYNNIVRLTGMLDRLVLRYGTGCPPTHRSNRPSEAVLTPAFSRARPPSADTPSLYAFPTAERLAAVPEKELRTCGLGYRAPYLKAAARLHASGAMDPAKLMKLENDALRETLLEVPGIGEKVVECVMLFGYGRESAFPVDVWIGRAMRRWYFRNRKVPDKKIRLFARKHFGPRCGWAQQYLYHVARTR
ncbi:MAG: hypothetical protein NC819_02535 [Candidatus Omnitrophica bacterium]|nr:hypothetical protein [Candidatus Omnitrophota bacterium]